MTIVIGAQNTKLVVEPSMWVKLGTPENFVADLVRDTLGITWHWISSYYHWRIGKGFYSQDLMYSFFQYIILTLAGRRLLSRLVRFPFRTPHQPEVSNL